jgi:hypothetical protein
MRKVSKEMKEKGKKSLFAKFRGKKIHRQDMSRFAEKTEQTDRIRRTDL